jgi:site-specific DNA-methyltransferase (adenine-specific)
MKPNDGTFANNALTLGVAGMNIDGGRVKLNDGETTWGSGKSQSNNPKTGYGDMGGKRVGVPNIHTTQGRFPANLIHDGSDEVLAGFPDSKSTGGQSSLGAFRNGDVYGKGRDERWKDDPGYGDTGSASRFFYTAKAHKSERNAGLDIDAVTTDDGRLTPIDNPYQRGKTKRQNHHPTVKPLELTKYLATLLLPPQRATPRRILVPFAGSGSEMIGAMLAGWDEIIGVEMSPEYVEIAQARLAWWQTVSGQLRTGDIARIMEYAYPQDAECEDDG